MADLTLKGNAIKSLGDLPKVGEAAKPFTLVNKDLSEVTLENFSGKIKVICTVPSLDTGTCATSAKRFNQEVSKFPNIVILFVSMDLPFAQKRFCESEGVNNVMTLSAFRSKFPEDYFLRITDGPIAGLCSRTVIIVNGENKIVYTQQVKEISEEPNYEEVLNFLKTLS